MYNHIAVVNNIFVANKTHIRVYKNYKRIIFNEIESSLSFDLNPFVLPI